MSELSAVVRFLHLTAVVLLAGNFAFSLFIERPVCARGDGRDLARSWQTSWIRLFRYWIAIIFVTALLGLWLHGLSVSEGSPTASSFRVLLPLISETHFGKVWLLRMALLIAVAALVFCAGNTTKKSLSGYFLASGFFLSASLLASIGLAGHAAAAEGASFALQVFVHALHLLATGLWLGGLVPLALLLRECRRSADADAVAIAQAATRRFSSIAVISVALLICTGSYNAWNLVGGVPPFMGTPYGKLLLIKIALLLPLLILGAVNRSRLKPELLVASLDHREPALRLIAKLRRNAIAEATFGALILLIVGFMGVTPPARHVQPDWPLSFRWDWSLLAKSPKALAEVQRGAVWATVGGIALLGAFAKRRRRLLAAAISFGAFYYAFDIVHTAVMIDAYPDTYKRPAAAYQALSVANGKLLYHESGCAICHGTNGYGDGHAALELNPKPPDLTAPHADNHTAGDLFWWLSYGVKPASAMPGYSQSLSEEERWDLINFMRALSSGEKARALAPVIEDEPWLVAPDFTYGIDNGTMKTLKDQRGNKIVLLVLLNVKAADARLMQLQSTLHRLQAAEVEVIVVPPLTGQSHVARMLPGPTVIEGINEITDTYRVFARSFADDSLGPGTPHAEFLIDKQGYIRARWLAGESDAWHKIDVLLKQVELLHNEKPRTPAPEDHVH
jgi:putative copper resistance protein D